MRLQPTESLSPAAAVTAPNGPLRVLILTADLPPAHWSGIGIAVENEARALARLSHAVTILGASPSVSADQEIWVPQVSILRPGSDTTSAERDERAWVPQVSPLRPGSEAPTKSDWEGVTVRHLPRNHFPQDLPRFDRIHLHSLALADLATECARRWQIPLLYTAHMLLGSELPDQAAGWRDAQNRLFRTADHVRFLNHSEREQATALNLGLRARSSVLAHGMEPSAHPVIPATNRQPFIVFSGRFCRNKGADIAAEAIELALARLPGWTALLAGGHGDPDCAHLIESAAACSRGRIRTPGWLPHNDLQQAVADAAMVLVPSRYEPFGLAALEALRAGTPVIAADTGGLSEMLRPDCGVLLPPSASPEKWADAIVALAADLPLRQLLADRGPAHLQQHFNALAQAQAMLQLLPPASRSRAA